MEVQIKMEPQTPTPPPPPEVINGEEHYMVEAFENHRGHGAYMQFLVKWKGYGRDLNEWVHAHQLRQDIDRNSYIQFVEAYLGSGFSYWSHS
jgi:hypothetical protein